jgi:hypothetical protein
MALKTRLLIVVLALSGTISAQNAATTSGTQASSPVVEPIHANKYDPLLDLPPLPNNTVSLQGGTITKLDRVHDRIAFRAFGSGDHSTLAFDVRTKFYRDGTEAHDRDLKPGQRIYADTMLNGTEVFAKSIWIQEGSASGTGAGQVIEYDTNHGILKLRDQLTAETLQLQLTPHTIIKEGNQVRSANVLVPGALVSLNFNSKQQKYAAVDQITILARPGYSVSFFGTITFLDLSRNLVAIQNRPDGKTYEVQLNNIPQDTLRKLHPGAVIGVAAVFDGKQYMARSMEFAAPSGTTPQ